MIGNPKPNHKERSVSDSYLMQWWRKAVRAKWKTCAFHGSECSGVFECHHIVKRRHTLLRYDSLNGILLCVFHHRWAETMEGSAAVHHKLGGVTQYYLESWETHLFKDYLAEHGISRNEFFDWQLKRLKQIVNPPLAKQEAAT